MWATKILFHQQLILSTLVILVSFFKAFFLHVATKIHSVLTSKKHLVCDVKSLRKKLNQFQKIYPLPLEHWILWIIQETLKKKEKSIFIVWSIIHGVGFLWHYCCKCCVRLLFKITLVAACCKRLGTQAESEQRCCKAVLFSYQDNFNLQIVELWNPNVSKPKKRLFFILALWARQE